MNRITAKNHVCPETIMTEWATMAGMAWWTLLLILPVHLFRSNLAFLGLEHRAGETTWAWATGGTTLLLLAGRLSGYPSVRVLGLAASASLASFIAACISLTGPHVHGLPVNTGFGIYTIMSVKSLVAAWMISPFALASGLHTRRRKDAEAAANAALKKAKKDLKAPNHD